MTHNRMLYICNSTLNLWLFLNFVSDTFVNLFILIFINVISSNVFAVNLLWRTYAKVPCYRRSSYYPLTQRNYTNENRNF